MSSFEREVQLPVPCLDATSTVGLNYHGVARNLSSLQARGVTPTGGLVGIHEPTRVMGQFAIFSPGYGSSLENLDLYMGLLY